MTRPTLKLVLLFSASAPIALLIIAAYGGAWHIALYYPAAIAAAAIADVLASLWPARAEIFVTLPRQMFVASRGEVEVRVTAEGYGRTAALEALLEASGDIDSPRAASSRLSGGQCALRLPITPRRRGAVTVAAVWLRWRSPMGLFAFTVRRADGGKIDVTPNIRGIYSEAVRFFSRDAEYGIKSQRIRGDGTEFDDLRDYEQGMDNRLIDWKSSARHRKILCKEFRQERNHHVVIGFDTGRLMTEPLDGMPRLDRAIRAGLLLGWVSLRNGDFLGGCGFDVKFRNFIKPNRGMTYFTRFQHFAAELAYRAEETNFTLGVAEINSRLTKRSLVVLFTEFADSIQAELLIESLRWMARRHVVIFVSMRDPLMASLRDAPPEDFGDVARSVIAGDFLRDRGVVLERVARLGVHCLDVAAAGLSSALLNRYLMIKQKGLL
jgi:uncharacterized protein (DUF58 family)